MSRSLPKCDCGDFIRWIVMRNGARIACNLSPGPTGTIWVDRAGRGVFLSKDDVERALAAGEELQVQHHSTCRLKQRDRSNQLTIDLFGDPS
jgi:hypothetical protein